MMGLSFWRGRSHHFFWQRGFTLLELVVVLILFGIVASLVLPKMGRTGFDERSFHDRLVSSLRYAQKSAVSARRRVCVSFSGNSASFSIAANFLDADCSTGGPLLGPDGAGLVVSAANGVSFAALPSSFMFDPMGRAGVVAGYTISINGLSAAIPIEAETGYVR